jgi:hypothetical protein
MKQDPEEKLARAVAELRALIREAHEAAQALKDAVKAAHAQVEDYAHDTVQTALNTYSERFQAEIDAWSAEARADCQRVVDNLNRAMNAVCTVVSVDMHSKSDDPAVRGDIVIDLRGQVPAVAHRDTPAGRAMIADAPYAVVVGPGARRPPRGAGPDGSVS